MADTPEKEKEHLYLVPEQPAAIIKQPEAAEKASPSETRRRIVSEAIRRSGGRRIERPPEPPTKTQQLDDQFEEEQAEKIARDIAARLSKHIQELMLQLDEAGRLDGGPWLTVSISNPKLLELLRQNGYIPEELEKEGRVDLTGLIAAQLLVSKDISVANKHLLLGPYRAVVKRVINDEVMNYMDMTRTISD